MQHILLSASPAGDYAVTQDGDSARIVLTGSPLWSRVDWLNSDLSAPAEAVAHACHVYDVPPVIRVGGSASGYNSLDANSGITDFGNVIKDFPWDVFANFLNRFYASAAPIAETPVVPAQLVGTITDGTTPTAFGHVEVPVVEHPVEHIYEPDADDPWVEQAAIHGDADALEHVIAVAAGDNQARAARAKAVLAQVPEPVLQSWERAHGGLSQDG